MSKKERNARSGVLMATMVLLIPIALILVFTLTGEIMQDSGQALMAQRRAKAFYLAQSGLSSAYHMWASNNFSAATHEADGVTAIPASDPQHLMVYGMSGFSLDGQGWYTWQWTPGMPLEQSYTRSQNRETFRWQVYNSSGNLWKIHCISEVDGTIGEQEQTCSRQPALDYMIFDNGDTTDFSRAEQHTVTGKIHANGNLYLRPWSTPGFTIDLPWPLSDIVLVAPQQPANLEIEAESITSAQRIIRHKDHYNNPDPGGNIYISSLAHSLTATVMEGLSQGAAGPGVAYDSYNPSWRSTAIGKYNGTMTDSELGAKRLGINTRQSLLPNGYYDLHADVHITSSTSNAWCTEKTFYNQNEEREVTVKELDVAAMMAANQMPANGVIYSDVPLRLAHADQLDRKLTVASCATLYTKGDFNADPDGNGPLDAQPSALLTSDRVYNLTSTFDDADSYNYKNPLDIFSPPPHAQDPPRHPGDPNNVLEINAAIADGSPTQNVRSWVDDPANPFYIPGEYVNPQTGLGTGVKEVPSAPGVLKIAYPNSDDLLENLQDITLKYRGSWMHQRLAKMAHYDNSDCSTDPRVTAWVVKSNYIPPQNRSYEHDPRLSDPTQQPPLAPCACRKLLWRRIR